MSENYHRFTAGGVVIDGTNMGRQINSGSISVNYPSGQPQELRYYTLDDLIDLKYVLTRQIDAICRDKQ